jgi:pyruvate carboxylase subunit B
MNYTVTIGTETFEIAIDGDEVTLAGRPVAASLTPVPRTPVSRLALEGDASLVTVEYSGDQWVVQKGGEVWTVDVADERTRQIRQMTGRGAARKSDGVVRAPMPGLVVRVEVSVGATVAPGQGLVVLEAMKMENEIAAPGGGTVRQVFVQPGVAVEKGAPLVEVAAEGSSPA